jgi:hypothetical protein
MSLACIIRYQSLMWGTVNRGNLPFSCGKFKTEFTSVARVVTGGSASANSHDGGSRVLLCTIEEVGF